MGIHHLIKCHFVVHGGGTLLAYPMEMNPEQALKRHGPRKYRLETVLLLALLFFAILAGCGLYFLKRQHDREAHLAATASLLESGVALLSAIYESASACWTHATPEHWRHFSLVADTVLGVRRDIQSLSITRDGVTVFHRQAARLSDEGLDAEPARHLNLEEIVMAPRTVEVGGVRYPVFVLSHEMELPGGERVLTEATLRRDAVSEEELTARSLVFSLYAFSVAVLVLSFGCCALVLSLAVARDRRREQRARQEEHLAFSGVLANGILHDFRNPMSAVRLDAQMLGRELARPDGFRAPRVAELAERIARAMTRMDKVFQEFLFLARPDGERPTSVDLPQVARECLDTLAPRFEQAGVTSGTVWPSDLPPASAFPFALRRALINVLVNAIHFSPRKGEVTVSIVRDGQSLVLDVLDQGPGIPAELRRQVFEMFVTGRPEGTGLGLFLARTAIRRCGGEIVALPRPGGGTNIRITLPVADQPVLPQSPPGEADA